jgi:hypothetical protein
MSSQLQNSILLIIYPRFLLIQLQPVPQRLPLSHSYGYDQQGPPEDEETEIRRKMERLALAAQGLPAPQIRKKLTVHQGAIPVDIASNFVRIFLEPGFGVYEYDVRFEPPVENLRARYALLDKLAPQIGKTKLYDGGSVLLVPKAIQGDNPSVSLQNSTPKVVYLNVS